MKTADEYEDIARTGGPTVRALFRDYRRLEERYRRLLGLAAQLQAVYEREGAPAYLDLLALTAMQALAQAAADETAYVIRAETRDERHPHGHAPQTLPR